MERNSEGKLVDNNGVKLFENDLFDQLANIENLSQASPNAKYVDLQANQVFFVYPKDARNYMEFQCSKLIDDNASLASDDTVKNQYLKNVISFLAILNKISKDAPENIKNQILGGTFPTKEDRSEDSMIPMYLCTEILRAKCLKHLDLPVEKLENLDVDNVESTLKTSTLDNQFDNVITTLKSLDYDKNYFNQDMSEASINYLSNCQIVPDGSVDVFAKCEKDKVVLYVTQQTKEGLNSQNITMYDIQNQIENNNTPIQQSDIANNVITPNDNQNSITNNTLEQTPVANENVQVNYSNTQQVNRLSKMNPRFVNAKETYSTKRLTAEERYKELQELRQKLSEAEKAYEIAHDEEQVAADELAGILAEAIGYGNNEPINQPEFISPNAALFK